MGGFLSDSRWLIAIVIITTFCCQVSVAMAVTSPFGIEVVVLCDL